MNIANKLFRYKKLFNKPIRDYIAQTDHTNQAVATLIATSQSQ